MQSFPQSPKQGPVADFIRRAGASLRLIRGVRVRPANGAQSHIQMTEFGSLTYSPADQRPSLQKVVLDTYTINGVIFGKVFI